MTDCLHYKDYARDAIKLVVQKLEGGVVDGKRGGEGPLWKCGPGPPATLRRHCSLLTKFIRQTRSYPFCFSIYIIVFTAIFKWFWNCSLFRLIRFYNFMFCVVYKNLRHNYRLRDKNIDCIFDGTSCCEGRLESCQASGGSFGISIRTRVIVRKYHKCRKIKAQHSCWLPTACSCKNYRAHHIL